MTNTDLANDARIVDSWRKNAVPWTLAVRQRQIESRRLITDQAIVEAIQSRSPSCVLDIGCGEGWLARTLAATGVHVVGLDVVSGLVEQAQAAGGGDFRVASHEDIAAGKFKAAFDVVVCNFALFGKESVEGLLASMPLLLKPRGAFIVQTLHPIVACGNRPYQDGWRQGSWEGFSSDFVDPAPWYFRTLESWIRMFNDNGLRLQELRQPLHLKTQQPASVIFITGVDD